jgi:hypothetical protein
LFYIKKKKLIIKPIKISQEGDESEKKKNITQKENSSDKSMNHKKVY